MTDPSPSATVWPPPLPSTKDRGRKQDRRRRRVPLVALVWASVGALVVGTALGGAGGASDKTELEERLAAVQQQLSTAEDSLDEQTEARAGAEAERSAAEASAAGLQQRIDTMTADAATSTTTLASRDARIAELEAAATAAAAAAPVAVAEVAPAAAPAAAAPAAASTGGAGAAFYANCDAVRAAGAAPIRTGDAGYSRKLDRDGDGVGCE
ncbi:hypothetical protein C5C95_14335 [Rathayibacter sp. AY1B7]|uniref:excalibur calcium-binding domain-containing protein n=1 Tax=unclassified Rathayibacter TaxID=2609250 RepID=UPI000CE88D47|nr:MULTISPECIES: excalibur calcium-binding domain-containing protein [unclassified Rathayibacter]PPH96304.1 hypothetical protein C5C95_14335 [Rathayibacter sp. AY1B7]PPI34927.1 hypothetical protein C5D50_16020 [Rathayibacter sp. RFBD1]PPI51486.1 hypothetical protein C5D38_15900 [Rathayibacter sp. TRS19]